MAEKKAFTNNFLRKYEYFDRNFGSFIVNFLKNKIIKGNVKKNILSRI